MSFVSFPPGASSHPDCRWCAIGATCALRIPDEVRGLAWLASWFSITPQPRMTLAWCSHPDGGQDDKPNIQSRTAELTHSQARSVLDLAKTNSLTVGHPEHRDDHGTTIHRVERYESLHKLLPPEITESIVSQIATGNKSYPSSNAICVPAAGPQEEPQCG